MVFLLLLGGFTMGASYGAVANDMSYAGKLVEGALIYAPGIMAVVGFAVLLFGFLPRATIPVTWFAYGAMYFILLASDAMRLPEWVKNVMPMTGTMRIPLGTFDAAVLWFAAAAVAFTGVIGFVGLIVPHAVRTLVGPDHRALLPLSVVGGAAFLVAADALARTVAAPAEIPVGAVTALLGGPFFLVLLFRRLRRP